MMSEKGRIAFEVGRIAEKRGELPRRITKSGGITCLPNLFKPCLIDAAKYDRVHDRTPSPLTRRTLPRLNPVPCSTGENLCHVLDLSIPKVVIIAAPANAHPALLRAVAPFVDDDVAVGALFAQVI